MKKTPLYDEHVALNAKMVEFGGWNMPIQYEEGIREETAAVRERVGMFDVSHMGEIRVTGSDAAAFLDFALSRKVSGRKPEIANYTILCYEDGGVVDDLLVYTFGENDYWLVVNAANKDKDLDHLKDVSKIFRDGEADVKIDDESDLYGQIAVQGKESLEPVIKALEAVFPGKISEDTMRGLKRFRQINLELKDSEARLVVSRTGYTGEDGYEIYMPADKTVAMWRALLEQEVEPCGLGARDALRLEAGLPLYGHEMNAEITPIEAGLGKFVELDREFMGMKMDPNPDRRLVSLISEDRQIPREEYPVFYNDEEVGYVTSGSFSPTLGKGIANALIKASVPEDVEEFEIQVRKKRVPFRVTEAPFVK